MSEFQQFFQEAMGSCDGSPASPYPYQTRFATQADFPHLLRAPTAAGKTATAILGWLYHWKTRPKDTPRRLAYCLPMRVLVEQSERESRRWIANLKLDIPVHVLMGGVESVEWYLHPEKPAVLIGTQDMLLSRALNRGYAASRFHWPIDFGLLNNDCLWVFDEPQLMANGVATSAQVAGLRKVLGTFGECPSVWMSATLEPSWLDTIDFAGKLTGKPLELGKDEYGDDYDPNRALYKRMTAAKTLVPLGESSSKDMKDVAEAVVAKHVDGTQTLVVLNTVERAKAVFAAINDRKKKGKNHVQPFLIHSRFRPLERTTLNAQLQDKNAAKDRIIVATQVIEAGVDISACTLITELAPWASIVQRIGRCNRTGDDGPGQVFWIDLDEKLSPPYTVKDLDFARQQLQTLDGRSVSPKDLDEFKTKQNITLPFEHKHVLRRRDLLDLFDTAPDLSGNDIDIQRFVRSDDPDTDVQVFWRATSPINKWDGKERRRQMARREELCNVPIGSFKKEFLDRGKTAHRFDHIDGEWREINKKDAGTVIPGNVFWIAANQGGYSPNTGWDPGAGPLLPNQLVPLPEKPRAGQYERPEGFYDSDEWAAQREWRTLAEHTDRVVEALATILSEDAILPITDSERRALNAAARWHDWGKVHAIFQSGLAHLIDDPKERKEKPDLPPNQRKKTERPKQWENCPDVAKAPQEYWQKYTRTLHEASEKQKEVRVTARRFRHELASALGVIRLVVDGPTPSDWTTLNPDERWLALYLIAAHHGKVRLSIRAMPDESPTPDDHQRMFASGVWDGDELPAADLGGGTQPTRVKLSLQPMQLGGETSWTANVLKRLGELGPFRLAYLESLLRAADCRASGEKDSDE
ncbi:MAG: helicase-related protein [Planctomycetota bacterium]|nr:helicase-related protein [Planctomycetota bacterium]